MLNSFDFEFETSQKKNVYGIGRVPENLPFKALCVGVHGYGEHCQRYEHLARFLVEHQIGFIGFDLLGHGKSAGKRGYISDIQEFTDQIYSAVALVKAKFPDVPLFIYGHSMGGNLVANFLQIHQPDDLAGAILTSPWFRLTEAPPKWKIMLANIMVKIYPYYTEKSTLDPNKLSTDPDIGKKYENDDLVHHQMSAGLFHHMTQGGENAIRNASVFKLPTLLMHGTDDQVTSYEATQEYAQNADNEQLEWIAWKGLRHELHNEVNKLEVMRAMTDFIDKYSLSNN